MKQLSLYSCLEIKPPAVVSFYGAGGKTTLLGRLASEMIGAGQKVLLTTTTKIFKPPAIPLFCDFDLHRAVETLKQHYRQNSIAVLGKQVLPDGKIEGIDSSAVQYLLDQLQVSILVEADGASGLPIKGYASHEPVLPDRSDQIIAVIGADALGASLNADVVHRLEQFLISTGTEEGGAIGEKLIAEAFKYMHNLGRAQAPRSKLFYVLNKADVLKTPGPASLEVARLLPGQKKLPERLLLTRGNEPNPVKITLNTDQKKNAVSVCCVLLAAGQSSRMGQDKLSLRVGRKTILERTLDQVIESGIKDIIVVTRPETPRPKLKEKSTCRIIENPHYKTGMAGSLQAGLSAVDEKTQGVIFALADQPMVPPEVYSLLLQNYQNKLKPLTAPVYRGKRGNPVLFDRRTWADLMRLSGDQGGRSIINKMSGNEVDYIETGTPAILADIDSPDDYLVFLNDS